MKSAFFRVACASLALAAVVACATSGEDRPEPAPPLDTLDAGDGGTLITDGGTAIDVVTDAAPSICSEAGWCTTSLPTAGLTLVDVWPLSDRAFAVAATQPPGFQDEHSAATVLEWQGDRWKAIDDGAQNDSAISPTSVWAPSDDEIYYAVVDMERILLGAGSYGAYVYHGTRAAAPATTWTWSRARFDCDHHDSSPLVWGTSKDDVYALACGVIHHSSGSSTNNDAGPDGGSSPWVAEYVDGDATNVLRFHGATGTSRDDAWFVATRGVCTVVVRRTSAGYQAIADALPNTPPAKGCQEKAGLLNVEGGLFVGGQALAKGRFVGIRTRDSDQVQDLARIVSSADGGYAVDFSHPSSPAVRLTSFWGASEDDLWFVGKCSNSVGGGCVLEGDDLWDDAGGYRTSTLAIRGAPNTQALLQIRGTSNSNLWAVGADRAFHKTTP